MKVGIEPARACGTVAAPPSKSMAHRLLLSAGLSAGESTVTGLAPSEDVLATLDCLRALGAHCRIVGNHAFIQGITPDRFSPNAVLSCRESGSTLRFFLPVCLLSDKTFTLTGSARLFERPLDAYRALCAVHGLGFSQTTRTVTVKGPLTGGVFTLPGNVSSQYVSGMLFALPLCEGESEIRLTGSVESRPYIDLTRAALAVFGVNAAWRDENTLAVSGGQRYLPHTVQVEGDYSGAAFFEALNFLGGNVTVTGLFADSLQGDRAYLRLFPMLAAGAPTVSLADCPDLAPVLFVLAALLHGAVFTDTRRLAFKESDRAAAMAAELEKCGADIVVEENRVTVRKTPLRAPKEPLSGHNDHRVVMALSVLLSVLGGQIEGAEAVRKSMPDFFEKLAGLGIGVDRYDTE